MRRFPARAGKGAVPSLALRVRDDAVGLDDTMPAISSEARSNSSSERTGVPSNGSSRLISSHERQPP
jgi:hypothetical protein